ncbi:MAG: Ni/Fe hydrogenase subunit alpha [Candidatus Marinimicrobia bacterium]|nr:Ni/Fe hydrogenase subunit alpha [Candidatus Neomarinimicrobiota bacterium]
MTNITDKYITKIEGHGSLETDWKEGEVKLHIHEGERLFEGLLVGRTIEESHWITPRICGVCPIAHNLASLRTCENGLEIKISKESALLRELMTCAQMMQSHALHLFFLALPDFLGIDRGTELAKKDPKSFKSALDIKEVSDLIATIIGGRNVHPVTTTVGGFHRYPTKKDLQTLLEKIKKTKKSAKHSLDLCSKIKFPDLKIDLELVAQEKGMIKSNKTEDVSVENYKETITEEIKNYSTAKFGSYKGREIMVGSLARMFFVGKNNPKLIKGLDFQNPFHNNLAQAIEIVIYHNKAERLIEQLLFLGTENKKTCEKFELKTGKGVGTNEAPRGGLYHELHFDEKGIITEANIITPTVQNLTSIEQSANTLLKQHENKSQKEKEHLLEMLVRAYDPCITCSVH